MGSAEARYVDLHVHTWHSDSSMSPQAAIDEAVRQGVGVIAIADHEGFEGSREARPLCAAAGIRLIPAAELECTHEGLQIHVLCYGARDGDAALCALAADSRRRLDSMSEWLVERMQRDYPALSMPDYAAFERDRALGGWKGLHYLMARGVTDSIKAGLALYARYGVAYADAGFTSLDALIETIHAASGRAVLAHPGHTLLALTGRAFERAVEGLVGRGFDGIECWYPLHGAEMTAHLRSLCARRGLLVTAGSDCHGTFGHTRIGEMNVTLGDVNLEGLL